MGKRAIFVLGMHRSGTSALTGMLSKLGVTMPANLLGKAPDNPKGFFESAAVVALSDEILASGHSNWFDWRPFMPDEAQTAVFDAKIANLLKSEFGDADLIGIKDPRLCRMAPLWFSAVKKRGYAPLVVIPYRHPYGTMQSLHKRSGLSMSKCKLLWLRHTLDAEFASRDYPRAFVYMPDLLNDWNAIAKRISMRLGTLPLKANPEIDSFIDKTLHHHAPDDDADDTLDDWTKTVLSALQGLDHDEDIAANQTRLDDIRGKLDDSTRLFGPAMVEADSERHGLANHVHHLQDELKRESAKIVEGLVLAESEVQAIHQALGNIISSQADTSKTQADSVASVNSDIQSIRNTLGDVITSQAEARQRYIDSLDWARFETQAIRQALTDIIAHQARADQLAEAFADLRNDLRLSREDQATHAAEREVWLHHQQVLAENVRHLYESYQAELTSLKNLLQDSTTERQDLRRRIESLQAEIQAANQNLAIYRQAGPLAYTRWALMRRHRP